jgi:hypothetical protein
MAKSETVRVPNPLLPAVKTAVAAYRNGEEEKAKRMLEKLVEAIAQ